MELSIPNFIATDMHGFIYVSMIANHSVPIFDKNSMTSSYIVLDPLVQMTVSFLTSLSSS